MLELHAPEVDAPLRDDEFRGRIGRTRGERGGTSGKLGARLTKAMKGAAPRASSSLFAGSARGFAGDQRQRVVAKVSFHKHGFGGGAGGGGNVGHETPRRGVAPTVLVPSGLAIAGRGPR